MIYRIEIEINDISKAKPLLAEILIDEHKSAVDFVYDTIMIDTDKTDKDLPEFITFVLGENDIETETKVQCFACEASGIQEIMTCYTQTNECCGGCIDEVDCGECNGEMWVDTNF